MNTIRCHAVLVGIDTYCEPTFYHSLKYAQSDAISIREKLIERSGGAFSPNTVLVLTDNAIAQRKPNRANIFMALGEMCGSAGEDDLILFYFAGHGFDYNDDSFLIASDTPPIGNSLLTLTDVAISVDRILEIMKRSFAKNKILLLDACRAPVVIMGTATRSISGEKKELFFTNILERTIDTHANLPGWELISACGQYETSHETSVMKGGVWTQNLLNVIDQLGSSSQITVEDLFKKTNEKVEKWSNDTKQKQTPYYKCDINKSIILFHPKETSSSIPTSELSKIVKNFDIKVLVRNNLGPLTIKIPWDELSLDASVHLVPFSSPYDRTDLKSLSSGLYKKNQDFFVRLYLPSLRRFPPKHKKLVIMFNGLGEADPYVFDDLGWELANRKGIPAVLIPLPTHFIRRIPYMDSVDDPFYPVSLEAIRFVTQQILNEIFCHPVRIIQGYKQILDDTKELLKTITDQFHPYWSYIFEKDVSTSLLGYSIGGFIALAYLLLNPKKVRSVILLESGLAIDQIDAGIMFYRPPKTAETLWKKYFIEADKTKPPFNSALEKLFSDSIKEKKKEKQFLDAFNSNDEKMCGENGHPERVFDRDLDEGKEIWRKIVVPLYSEVEKFQFITPKEKQIFKWVFLGNESLIYKAELYKFSEKVLIIVGGADSIFPLRLVLNVGPDSGMALVQVPELTHWIKYQSRETWQRWKNVLIDFLETFDTIHPPSKFGYDE